MKVGEEQEPISLSKDAGFALRQGGIEFEGADKRSAAPNFAPFRQKSLGDCTRPLLPTQGWLTGLTKNGHVPKGTCGLMGIQHPAVLDDHPVVSAQSQLRTCEGP